MSGGVRAKGFKVIERAVVNDEHDRLKARKQTLSVKREGTKQDKKGLTKHFANDHTPGAKEKFMLRSTTIC